MRMIPGKEEISQQPPHLPVQDNAPQQPQCQLVISINDVGSSDIHQLYLERSEQLCIKQCYQSSKLQPHPTSLAVQPCVINCSEITSREKETILCHLWFYLSLSQQLLKQDTKRRHQ